MMKPIVNHRDCKCENCGHEWSRAVTVTDPFDFWSVHMYTCPKCGAKHYNKKPKGFEVGGYITDSEIDKNGNRIVHGIKLLEISIVDDPPNPHCIIDDHKPMED